MLILRSFLRSVVADESQGSLRGKSLQAALLYIHNADCPFSSAAAHFSGSDFLKVSLQAVVLLVVYSTHD